MPVAMHAVASFELDSFNADEPYFEDGGIKHARSRIEKTFHGDLEGHGSVEMLAAQSDAGAGYVAVERITGALGGRSGGFSLLHVATMAGTEPWGRWLVVPGSGSGELSSIHGEGEISIDAAGKHRLRLEYQLD